MAPRGLSFWAGLVIYLAPGISPTPGIRIFLGQIPTALPKTQVIDIEDRYPLRQVDEDLLKKPFLSVSLYDEENKSAKADGFSLANGDSCTRLTGDIFVCF